jgi:hypothetical protein
MDRSQSRRRRKFRRDELRRLRREYIEERKPNLAKLLEKDLHNDNWALKKNRLNSDESLSEEPYYTQPQNIHLLFVRVYSGNDSRSINVTVAGSTIQKVENLINDDDWQDEELRCFGDVSSPYE